MKTCLILIAALFLLPLVASGQDLDPYSPANQYMGAQQRLLNHKPTPEEIEKAKAYKAKKAAEKEALAIIPANPALRVWRKGKDPIVASKGNHPTKKAKAPTSTPIPAKLIKIYPDTVILEKKDQTTLEVARKDLVKADRALIDRIAEQNAK